MRHVCRPLFGIICLTCTWFGSAVFAHGQTTKVLAKISGTLKDTDAKNPLDDGSTHRVHKIKLSTARHYQIDVESSQFDPKVRVQDVGNQVLLRADDGGDNLGPRVAFTPKKTAQYDVIVTAVPYAAKTGDYTLTIREINAAAAKRLNAVQAQMHKIEQLNSQVKKLYQQRRVRDALPLLQQVAVLSKKTLGDAHPHYASSLHSLSIYYAATGENQKALTHIQQAQTIYRATVGATHFLHVMSLRDQLRIYQQTGQQNQAMTLLLQLRSIYKKIDQTKTSRYAKILHDLASGYQDLAQYQKALPLYLDSLRIYKDTKGAESTAYIICMANLATLYDDMGDYKTGLKYAVAALHLAQKKFGEQSPDYAYRLNGAGTLYYAAGMHAKAMSHLETALAIFRKSAPKSRGHAVCLGNLANVYRAMGHIDKARKAFQGAAPLFKNAFPNDPLPYTNVLNNWGSLHFDMGAYPKALALMEQARKIRRARLTELHPSYATSLNNIAAVYRQQGLYQKALTHLLQAVRIEKKMLPPNHPSHGTTLNNLGGLYQDMGDYGGSFLYHKEAADIRLKSLGEKHVHYSSSLNNLANLYQHMGAYHKALSLYLKAKRIRLESSGKNHPEFAAVLNNIGMFYQDTGVYEKALPLFVEALRIHKNAHGENHPDYGTTLNNLAGLYRHMLLYDKALPLYRRFRDIIKNVHGEDHPSYALALNNLAMLYQDRGEYIKALPLLQQALKIRRDIFGESHPDCARGLNNLAGLYLSLNLPEQARPLYEQSLKIRQKTLGKDHPDYASGLNNLAALYQLQGEYDKALPLLEEANAIFEATFGDKHPSAVLTFNNLATRSRAKGDSKKAVQFLTAGLNIQKQVADRTFAVQTQNQRRQLIARSQYLFHAYLSFGLHGKLPAAQLYSQWLAWKGTAIARHAEDFAAADDPNLRDLIEKIRTQRANLAKLYRLAPPDKGEKLTWKKRFQEAEQNLEGLEVKLAQKSAPFRRFRKLRQVTYTDVQSALPKHTALIDFLFYTHWSPPQKAKQPWITEQRLLAVVLTKQSPPAIIELGSAKPIQKSVRDWRRAVTSGKGEREITKLGATLRQQIWQPFENHLEGVDIALVAPDGVLCQLPFAALPGNQPQTYLLDEKAIGYVISARQLLELDTTERVRTNGGQLVIGGLAYGKVNNKATLRLGPTALIWQPLPGSLLEANQVHQRYQQVFKKQKSSRKLTGATANAEVIRQALSPPSAHQRWHSLHIATHGFFQAPRRKPQKRLAPVAITQENEPFAVDHPLLFCSLVFSGANSQPENGFLTGKEIAAMDLRGLDLVVLSACDTGIGQLTHGEGVLGLQQAFHLAGSKTQVASLWSISDAATAVLMEEFYRNLWQKKMSKLGALRQAQRTVLHHPQRIREMERKLLLRGYARNRPLDGIVVHIGEVVGMLGVSRSMADAVLTAARTPTRDYNIPWRRPGLTATRLPAGGLRHTNTRSHPVYWAAFVLSGDAGDLTGVTHANMPTGSLKTPARTDSGHTIVALQMHLIVIAVLMALVIFAASRLYMRARKRTM